MNRRSASLLATLLCWALWPGVAIHGAPWTIKDIIHAERLGGSDVTADGSTVVWTQSSVSHRDGKAQQLSRLWMARLDVPDAEPVALTHGGERLSGVTLSPDGRRVAFVSNRPVPDAEDDEGTAQIWVLPLAGGEAKPVTSGSRGPSSFRWIDNESLLVARLEAPSLREQLLKKNKESAYAVDDPRDNPPLRLFRVDLQGKTRRLGLHEGWVEGMAVSPDGSQAVVSFAQSTRFSFDSKIPPKTFLVDLETGDKQQILDDSGLLPRSFQWAPRNDGNGFYFIDNHSSHPIYRHATVAHLYFFDVDASQARRLRHGWERGIGAGFSVVPGGVVALMADGARYVPARIDLKDAGLTELKAPGDHRHLLDQLSVSADGSRWIYVHSTADQAPQLYTAPAEGGAVSGASKALTELNASYKNRPSGRTEIISWKGAEGDMVEGVLSYPFDWQEGKTYPLVLDIHGGPTGYDRNSWDASWGSPTPLWRQRGAFVLRVNYHGSGNYGLAWAESIRERYYELEVPDIEAGVDHLIQRGMVDADRLATTGWSNGGILSAALIAHTDRYKAAVVGAADVEWISDWGNVDFGASFDNYYFGGTPWERLDHYIEKSPFFKVNDITTPTLLHTGTEDRNVPPHQSWSMFRAMQFVEKTDVRLVLYPGEPHGLRQIPHQRRKAEEDLEWLDRHLFKRPATPSVIPDHSPLAARMALTEASKTATGHWGMDADERLIPETVTVAGPKGEKALQVGRFEVTVDQWRAFDADAFPELAGDLPATGLTFEQARDYVTWLSKVSGTTYRLPTKKEAGAWRSGDGKGGGQANTLDRWLGKTPSVDDRRALLDALGSRQLGLLKPVGQSDGKATSEGHWLYDLKGNVAEWTVDDDGQGQAVGGSADRPAGSMVDPDPQFIGLRVILGAAP